MKEFAVGLTMALLLPFVVYYGVIAYSPAAKYHKQVQETFLQTFEDVVTKGKKPDVARPVQMEAEYRAGVKEFNKHFFLVAVPVGVLSIAIGLVFSVPGIGPGLMFGGIFTLIYGYSTYWDDLPIRIKFLSLLIGLTLLIIVGWLDQRRKSKAK